MSYREDASFVFEEAMKVQTEEEADAFVRKCVETSMDEASLRTSVAYFAGYYDNATRERVERLFKAQHPIFGSIAENGPPTTEEAFELGELYGRGMKTTLLELRRRRWDSRK